MDLCTQMGPCSDGGGGQQLMGEVQILSYRRQFLESILQLKGQKNRDRSFDVFSINKTENVRKLVSHKGMHISGGCMFNRGAHHCGVDFGSHLVDGRRGGILAGEGVTDHTLR